MCLSHCWVECYLFGKVASLVWRAENLVVEDRKVQGEAQVNGVCWLHLTLAQIKCLLVGFLRVSYSSWKKKERKICELLT